MLSSYSITGQHRYRPTLRAQDEFAGRLPIFVLCTSHAQAFQPTTVTAEGLGKAKFGMTLDQLNRAFGENFIRPTEADEQACFYVTPKGLPGAALMIEDGRLTRIDIRTKRLTTADRMGIGVRLTIMKSRYGAKLEDEPHHYTGPEGRYLTLSLSKSIAARFEVNDEKVTLWYVGLKESVQYVEGCL